MSRKRMMIVVGAIAVIGAIAVFVVLRATIGGAPSESELAAAIEDHYTTAEIRSVSISEQSYFCPQECTTDYFRNQFSGAGAIVRESYRRLSPALWVTQCGLSEEAAEYAPRVPGRDLVAPVGAYELQPTQGLEFTFSGRASTEELPDGSWELGAVNIDFVFDDPDVGATAFGTALSELDQIHFVIGTPEFDRLCALTEQSAEIGQVIEGEWPPLSLVEAG